MLASGPTPAELALSIASSSCDMSLPFIASRRAASARPASSASSRCWYSLSLSRPCCTKSGETFAAGFVSSRTVLHRKQPPGHKAARPLQARCLTGFGSPYNSCEILARRDAHALLSWPLLAHCIISGCSLDSRPDSFFRHRAFQCRVSCSNGCLHGTIR